MVMSPYVTNKNGLSPDLFQKIGFLEEHLESKFAQYGTVTFVKQEVIKKPYQSVVMTGKKGGLVDVNVAADSAYIFSDVNFFGNDEKISLTIKVDIMPGSRSKSLT